MAAPMASLPKALSRPGSLATVRPPYESRSCRSANSTSSNIYWNAPMPYMQRITWSGVTLHAGPIPGYPDLHGCIRLPHQFAVKLWRMTKIGARIIVVPNGCLSAADRAIGIACSKTATGARGSRHRSREREGRGYQRRKSLRASRKGLRRVAQCQIGSSQAAQSAGARQVLSETLPSPTRRRRPRSQRRPLRRPF